MIETLKRIEARIENSPSLSGEAREELLGLLADLKQEIDTMPAEGAPGNLPTALGLAEVSAQERIREDEGGQSKLREQISGALQTATDELEGSHPKLAEMIGRISHILSRMGI